MVRLWAMDAPLHGARNPSIEQLSDSVKALPMGSIAFYIRRRSDDEVNVGEVCDRTLEELYRKFETGSLRQLHRTKFSLLARQRGKSHIIRSRRSLLPRCAGSFTLRDAKQ